MTPPSSPNDKLVTIEQFERYNSLVVQLMWCKSSNLVIHLYISHMHMQKRPTNVKVGVITDELPLRIGAQIDVI